ncbi:MAG TPA: methylated-DNA--[protein]-cysteine S-methyltransferase [Fimbriimonadaceae bacterium]|nr:methylated-DNA--[protein]-cysteine S-methyltransferase [Fimbriimonadaceae bacterium]
MTYYDTFDSPIGTLLATSDGESLTGIYMENHKGGPKIGPGWRREPDRFADIRRQLADYFAGRRQVFDLPLALIGTPFQKQVWDELLAIPFGETTTYGTIARKLGEPNASRAVGAAVGKNPISIVVPCHRVLGSSGAITGFAGGLDRKRRLLDLESKARDLFTG